jgi:hypothetical protein
MLRAEDVKRYTPVSCSLVSLALSADTTSQNLTSCSSDEWICAIDLHLNKDIYILNGKLGLIHIPFSRVDLTCLVQLSCGWIRPEVFGVNTLSESVWRMDTIH